MYLEEEPAPAPGDPQKHRSYTLDVCRGLVLALLLLASVNPDWHLAIAEAFPDSWLAGFLGTQASHSPWVGATIRDLVQPAFLFIAGIALTYSCNRRSLFGERYGAMFLHIVIRSAILIFLGVFLQSNAAESTRWTFVDPLTQIGLGYVFLFLLWDRPWKLQALVAVVILFLHWLWFSMAPLPGPGFDWSVAEGEGWEEPLAGFAAHWNKNTNPAHAFDVRFLNGFSRVDPFAGHPGGYVTLNFIPSLVVMILGLMAGECIRTCGRNWETVKILALAGVAGLVAGMILDATGVCPLVKRIWTASFVLYSTGWCLLVIAGLLAIIEMAGLRAVFRPFAILGMNSITIYVAIALIAGWLNATLKTHLGQKYGAALFGESFRPLVENLVVGTVLWLVAWAMYRRRMFLRI